MKITLVPTAEMQTINGNPHRVWRGQNDAGTPVQAFIRAVVPLTTDARLNAAFEEELVELPQPTRDLPPISLRQVL
jgi:hypothetical protein